MKPIRWMAAFIGQRTRHGWAPIAASFVAAMLVSGCSSSNPLGTVPVTGKVTYRRQPVAGATVTFLGKGEERPATGVTDANGTYELATLDSPGAMPGQYAVLVDKTELPPELTQEVSMEDAAKNAGKPPPQPKRLLPAKYGTAEKTPLQFEVKAGQDNTIDLALND